MKLPVEYLIPKYQNNLYQAAFSILQDPADAQDAVQLAFIKYHRTGQDYTDESHIRSWLFRTVLNQAKDIRRAFWRRSRTSLDETAAMIAFETPQDRGLFEAVCQLPAGYRVVLQLFYYEDFSIREIAGLADLTEATVKKRLSRGRKMLRERLEGEEHDQNR